jgi:hypothetical protein
MTLQFLKSNVQPSRSGRSWISGTEEGIDITFGKIGNRIVCRQWRTSL